MKNTFSFRPFLSSLIRTVSLAVLALPIASSANPYASAITNSGGTVSFILNESATSVNVVLDGGASTLSLGALNKGTHSFNLGGATTFQIVVTKITPAGWTLISSDTNTLLRFNSPRGVAVNHNANSPAFGRIYVANSDAGTASGRSVGDGLYLLNADQTDALGRGDTVSTAGIVFNSGNQQAFNPWHIEVGPDNFLYIGDFSTNSGTIYRTDLDVSPASGINIFPPYGTTDPTNHTTISSSPIVLGSLATSDLTVWAIDGRFPGTGNNNRLFRWNIGAGPLPHSSVPTALANPLITSTPDITTDLARGPDGKFYLMQNRSVGNESGITVVDTNGTTILWRSLVETRAISNNPTAVDILRISRGVAISPDGSKMAVIRDDLQTWVIPLLNGIPDLTNRELVITHSGAPTTLGRDVCFDPAGNLYALSSGNQLLRIFSPGGATTATTSSDGTFTVTVQQLPSVSVSGSDAVANEEALAPGEFTIARTGSTATELVVNYTLTGTASNGVDYSSVSLTATIPAGQSTVAVPITPVDDIVAELTESVVLTIASGSNYIASPTNATVQIVDNEYPNTLSIVATDSNMYERTSSDAGTFTLTRYGDTNIELFVSFTVSGAAVLGVDYTDPGNFIFNPGEASKTINIAPLNDNELEEEETITFQLVDGGDYAPGEPSVATLYLRDDEWAPAPILFSEYFESEEGISDWVIRFGANNGIYDATNIFAYDYAQADLPLAPHSPPDTLGRGLLVAVNKYNSTALGAAGINLYPKNRMFSGDYALRFDMFLNFGTAGTTEHALAGLNHSGLLTNRVTQSTDPENTTRGGDGIWMAIETDASGNRDYTAYTTTNQATVPAVIASRAASSMSGLIPRPPYAIAGSPGNSTNNAPTWASVEISQVASIVTLKVNAATVFTITNTSGYNSGNIMIGMNDQFDSVGSTNNFVIFANLEVVSLSTVPLITGITFPSETLVTIDFRLPLGANPADYHLQSTDTLSPPVWADDNSATITAVADGYRATTTRANGERYYRIRR